MVRHLVAAVFAIVATGCTWVPLQTGAAAVRVLPPGAMPAACTKLGEIEVEVTDRVAFYERNALRVREELETLARNEAVGLGADSIQPLADPREGSQRFSGLRCRRA